MNLRRLAVALVLASSALRVHAFTIEYAVDRPVPLVKCDQLRYRGSRNDAQTCYRALVADSKDTRIRADAARASGDARGANGFFQAAIKEYPQDASVRVRWGELFLATHQNNEAVKLFQEALELDEKYAPAILGLAKVAASGFEEKTREYAKKVIDEAADPREWAVRVGGGHRRRKVIHDHRVRATLCRGALSGVVHDERVHHRQIAQEQVGVAVAGDAHALAGQPFE